MEGHGAATGAGESVEGGSIGRYRIEDRIGTGGYSTVFKAWDPVGRRHVAIKTCKLGEDMHARFFREAEIAGRLDHPNITVVYESGIEGSTPYIVQEFLDGQDLSALIARSRPAALSRKIDILVDVASGLEYAHGAGVIHRDVKPANVRVLENGSAKIMDFGIAKALGAPSVLTGEGVAMGSMGYMSPEQISGDPLDFRSDIFSFGLLTYELVSFRRAFRNENLFRLLEMIVKEEPEPLARIAPAAPDALVALVDRAIQKSPGDRFGSMREVLEALESARENGAKGPGRA